MNYIRNNIFFTINDRMIFFVLERLCRKRNDNTYTHSLYVVGLRKHHFWSLLTRYQTLRTFYCEGYLVLAGLSKLNEIFHKCVLCKRKNYNRSFEFNFLNEKPYKLACPVDALLGTACLEQHSFLIKSMHVHVMLLSFVR